jgi:hypothetical protein
MPVVFPDTLKQVIINCVINPIFNHASNPTWDNLVSSKIVGGNTFDDATKTIHRNQIVQSGQADFTNPLNGLSTDDLATLYAFYYFQMHFSSTTTLFEHNRDLIINQIFRNSNRILFLDIGCGPFTSGLAFLNFTRLPEITNTLAPYINSVQLEYYGIDNATSMRNLGSSILAEYEMNINDGGFCYSITNQSPTYTNINSLITNCDNQTTIIINCCYFFASQSIIVKDFTNAIQQVITNNLSSKIVLFYQNAPSNALHIFQNYLTFKQLIQGLSANGLNIQELGFSFADEFKSANRPILTRNVRFQILKNF